jgi:hypothetical protein
LKYGIVYNYCTSLNLFNHISVMSWRSVILVEEAGENHRPVASNWQTLSQIVVDPTTMPSRPARPLLWICIKHLNIIQVYNLKHTYHHLGNCTCTGDIHYYTGSFDMIKELFPYSIRRIKIIRQWQKTK